MQIRGWEGKGFVPVGAAETGSRAFQRRWGVTVGSVATKYDTMMYDVEMIHDSQCVILNVR